jgi:hypothetical protein
VPQRPALLQCTNNQHDLHDNVDEQEDRGEDVDDYEEANGALWAKTSPALECEQCDHEADDEHGQTADAQQPDRECSAIFVELETDKAVDHQTYACGAHEAALHSNEVWVCFRPRWYDTTVDDERAYGEQSVEVEEGGDFLATCSVVVSQDPNIANIPSEVLFCDKLSLWLSLCPIPLYVPTAVNLLLTCMIMITSMINVMMCANPAAPWKIIVFASSIDRE